MCLKFWVGFYQVLDEIPEWECGHNSGDTYTMQKPSYLECAHVQGLQKQNTTYGVN